jgi:4-aminobutyrate aminotransferase-like enzyme/Ser/Thr protein kinase RdoA (MazF antagonist)
MSSTVTPRITFTPPRFDEASAASLALERFGIEGRASTLPSERDQNFAIETSTGDRFVLKLSHAEEQRQNLECQDLALETLARADTGYTFPRAMAALSGERIVSVPARRGSTHHARMMYWVPGIPLAHVRPHTPELLHELGAMLGQVDRALASFAHPAATRVLKWDLRHGVDVVEQNAGWVTDRTRRALIERYLRRLRAIAPALATLRTAVIHGDANDHNVLVTATRDDPLRPRSVTGLLDFGDLVHSWVVAEPAIAAAYAMLDRADPLASAAHVVRGYHSANPLDETELELLYPLICLRLCTSVVLSAESARRHPTNEYLMVSEKGAWTLLERLADVDPAYAMAAFRLAAELEPCRSGHVISAWLAQNRDSFAPILGTRLEAGNVVTLDLSAGSTDLDPVDPRQSASAWTEALFGQMRQARARFGIGRYSEARFWYDHDAFRVAGDDGDAWRTIHLGVDLFAKLGTPVCSPLDGTVHSFADNKGRFDYGPTIVLQHDVTHEGAPLRFYTLYGHLAPESLRDLRAGASVQRGERIGSVATSADNGGWAPHVHVQVIADMLGHAGTFPGVVRPADRDVWQSICPDPSDLVGWPAAAADPRPATRSIQEMRGRSIGRSLSISYRRPLHIVRGWMQHLYDVDAQPYLDAVNNVAHVGHSHPRVVAALRRQAAALNTNTRYLHGNLVHYAERLAEMLPEPLSVLFFVCSGSEANELALRLARAHTRRRDVVVVGGAYHGNTTSLIELSPYKYDGAGGDGRPPHVHEAVLPDGYRGPYRGLDAETGRRYADHVRAAFDAAAERGSPACAFFFEPLPGCGGQIVPPDSYLREAFRHAHQAGAVCVADEVQTGFGRVGSHFWAFQAQGAVPDIVTMGKPIGNGHPLGAVATTPDIAASFANGMEYFNTFGGNPVSCAVGLAVLDVIRDQQLQQNALRVGNRLLGGLRDLARRHPLIGDVRGLGLYVGVELVLDRKSRLPAGRHASYVAERMRDHHILISTDGPDHNVLKIKPPLVFSDADADRLVETLDRILAEDPVRHPTPP